MSPTGRCGALFIPRGDRSVERGRFRGRAVAQSHLDRVAAVSLPS